jgi:hypothetical protein
MTTEHQGIVSAYKENTFWGMTQRCNIKAIHRVFRLPTKNAFNEVRPFHIYNYIWFAGHKLDGYLGIWTILQFLSLINVP